MPRTRIADVGIAVSEMLAPSRQLAKANGITVFAEGLKAISYPLMENRDANLEAWRKAMIDLETIQSTLGDRAEKQAPSVDPSAAYRGIPVPGIIIRPGWEPGPCGIRPVVIEPLRSSLDGLHGQREVPHESLPCLRPPPNHSDARAPGGCHELLIRLRLLFRGVPTFYQPELQ